MQRKYWLPAIAGCLASAWLLFSPVGSDFEAAAQDRGRGGGGERSAPSSRGGGGSPARGVSRGTMHVPNRSAGRPTSASRQGSTPAVNRAPTFSRPNVSGTNRVAQPSSPRTNIQPQSRPDLRNDRQNIGVRNSLDVRQSNSIRQNNFDGRTVNRGDVNVGRNSAIRVGNQSLGGNSLAIGNRNVNLANSNYRPAYSRHSGYHGYWNGNYGGNRWGYGVAYGAGYNRGFYSGYGQGYPYFYRPLGWGLGAWGLGRIAYGSGYLGYANPYYNGYAGYNYAQPIAVSYVEPVTTTTPANDDSFNAAVSAFQSGDYDKALDLVNQGIVQAPNDAVLHEFRSLVLFAKGDYNQSAATIHAVLAVGPGWNWTTLSSIYNDVAVYTQQLRALEAAVRSNPAEAAPLFLLAYHYTTAGHNSAAVRQLQQVVKLKPGDRVAADLLRMLSPEAPQPATTQAESRPESTRATIQPSVDPKSLVGEWSAQRDDGSRFALTLSNESTFKWRFTQQGQKPVELTGGYTVEGDVLALEGSDGGSLIATVTPGTEQDFNFKLLGAPESDSGLDFRR